jgi:serine/threonine protein kinase
VLAGYREPVEGTPFGRYQLIELLGRGGMGEVWRAHDTDIDRTVALKMLLPHFAKDPEFEKRFRREARAAARLDDPHVVPIHDVGEIDGRLYVTMRLINGVDLQTMLNSGPMDGQRAVHIVEQIASALSSAHQAGLVHRDVAGATEARRAGASVTLSMLSVCTWPPDGVNCPAAVADDSTSPEASG